MERRRDGQKKRATKPKQRPKRKAVRAPRKPLARQPSRKQSTKPDAKPAAASLKRLRIGDVERLLSQGGCRHVTVETLRADIAAGAPVNRDGTINFLSFVAWICQEGAA